MKTIFICLLLLISQPQFLSAQRYLPAKITLTDGQILEGSVLYKDWDDTPQRLDFKNQQGQTRRLGVADIAAFEVARSDKGTEVFRRKIAYIDVSPHKLDKLDEHSVPQFVLDTVLVQVLVLSEISLYRYQDAASKLHYLIEKDSVAELVFKQFYVPTERGREVAMNNSFRQQLSKLTPAKCAGRVPDFKRLRFVEKELIKAVSKINDCRSAKTAYAYRAEKRPIELTFLLGGSSTSNKFKAFTPFMSPLLNVELEPSLCVVAGMGAHIYLSRANKRFSFSNELIFQANKAKGRYENDPNQIEYEVRVDEKSLQVNTFLRAHIAVGSRSKILLDGGFVNAFRVGGNSRLILERHYNDGKPPLISDSPLFFKQRTYENGFIFGGGFAWQRYSLSARVTTGRAFSPTAATQLRTKMLSVVAGYTFK